MYIPWIPNWHMLHTNKPSVSRVGTFAEHVGDQRMAPLSFAMQVYSEPRMYLQTEWCIDHIDELLLMHTCGISQHSHGPVNLAEMTCTLLLMGYHQPGHSPSSLSTTQGPYQKLCVEEE